MPIRLGRLPAFGGWVLGRRTGRLHCGSGARMGRRGEQSGIQEVTYLAGQLTTHRITILTHTLFSVLYASSAAPGAAALRPATRRTPPVKP